jgi:hypothetical protein
VFNEARIAQDIVDGIKSKSMYLWKIEELNQKLKITNELNNELTTENSRIKQLLVRFIEKYDIGICKINAEEIKTQIDAVVVPLVRIQEKARALFVSKTPEKCVINEDPFK